jgi:uncharacterized protein YbjT (DUF2867 family)
VLRYLVGSAALPPDVNRPFDIGGPDILTYAEMMRRYSGVAGLRSRVLIPVLLLTPRLSSLWVGLVTPVPAGLARPLVESLRNEAASPIACTATPVTLVLAPIAIRSVPGPRPAGAADPLIPRVRGGWVWVQVNDP